VLVAGGRVVAGERMIARGGGVAAG